MMIINQNDPKYKTSFKSKIVHLMTVRNVKIRRHNNTKSHFLEFFIKSIQTSVKLVYNRVKEGNLHQFQCYTM